MLIKTFVEFEWNDRRQEYVPIREISFDYAGPVSLCKGGDILGDIGSLFETTVEDIPKSVVPGFDPIIGNPLTGDAPIITPTGNWSPETWQQLSDNGMSQGTLDAWQTGNNIADKIIPGMVAGPALGNLAEGFGSFAGEAGAGLGDSFSTGFVDTLGDTASGSLAGLSTDGLSGLGGGFVDSLGDIASGEVAGSATAAPSEALADTMSSGGLGTSISSPGIADSGGSSQLNAEQGLSDPLIDSGGASQANAEAVGDPSLPDSGGASQANAEATKPFSKTVTDALKKQALKTGTSTTIDQALKKLEKYGPLGMQAISMLKNSGLSQKYSKEMANIGAPQRDVANQMIQQAQSGQINQSDQYAIDQWKQSAIAQAKSYYAKAGLSDSSMATQAIADINSQAEAKYEAARQKLLSTGMSALNVVDKYQQAAVQAEMQGDQAAAKQATDFLSAYGSWLRGQNGSTDTAKQS